MNQYTNYFKDHYRISSLSQDLPVYRKWFLAQWKMILSKINIKKSSHVLEIGAGVGTVYSFLQPIIDKGNYIGLELDKKASDSCNEYFKINAFRNESIENFKHSQKFDYVFAFEVLEHVSDPYAVIKKIHEVLVADGVFVGTSPYPYYKNVYADKTHRYVLHPSNWKKLFVEQGFRSVETYPMSFIPYIWRIHPIFNVRIPFYIPFPYFISTTLIIARK
jgi:SAM-dependent methyltransferase